MTSTTTGVTLSSKKGLIWQPWFRFVHYLKAGVVRAHGIVIAVEQPMDEIFISFFPRMKQSSKSMACELRLQIVQQTPLKFKYRFIGMKLDISGVSSIEVLNENLEISINLFCCILDWRYFCGTFGILTFITNTTHSSSNVQLVSEDYSEISINANMPVTQICKDIALFMLTIRFVELLTQKYKCPIDLIHIVRDGVRLTAGYFSFVVTFDTRTVSGKIHYITDDGVKKEENFLYVSLDSLARRFSKVCNDNRTSPNLVSTRE